MHEDYGEDDVTNESSLGTSNTSFVDDEQEDTKSDVNYGRSDSIKSLIDDDEEERNRKKELARDAHEARKLERKQEHDARKEARKEMESKERAMTETEEDKVARKAKLIQNRLDNETEDQ